MDVINYASSFIPNKLADNHILYDNIKKYNSNFSLESLYVKEFNYVNRKLSLSNVYDIDETLEILNEYDYIMDLDRQSIVIMLSNPKELVERLDIINYIIHSNGIEVLPDDRLNIDIDVLYQVMLHETNLSRGYIIRNIHNVYEYYHTPEPIYNEIEYKQYHLNYLSEHNMTMYSIAEEQRFLYTLARELPVDLRYILDDRDNIDSIIFNHDLITIFMRGNHKTIDIDNASLNLFKSLIANLYHGNTIYDYLRLKEPNKVMKTYTLHDI